MPTPEARIFARNALADDPGELDEDWLADQLDRFAAQRGAEAQAEADRLRADVDRLAEERYQAIVERDKALAVVPEYPKRSYMADFGEGAPPQTGGGAPHVPTVDEIVPGNDGSGFSAQDHLQTGGGDAGERAREVVEAAFDEANEMVSYGKTKQTIAQAFYETVICHVDSALRSSHREGAEAMREALREAARTEDMKRIISALPIPGKTDAGLTFGAVSGMALATGVRPMPDKTTPQIEKAALAMKRRASEPVGNLASLDSVLVGSLGDTWPYLAEAALSTTLEPSMAELVAALRAYDDAGGDSSNPTTEITAMRAALIAAARVRVGE